MTPFDLGLQAATEHYARFDAGEVPELPFPANPYPETRSSWSTPRNLRTEWERWNDGWVSGAMNAEVEAAIRLASEPAA